ncbi:NAD-dependent epimerase/dehydratase family protein [Phocaeicola sp.]
MKYVITGATSFLGSAVANLLLERGDEVLAVCRAGSPKLKNINESDNLSIVYSDFDQITHLSGIVERADIFMNFAWVGTSHALRDSAEIHKSNVINTLHAIETASRLKCHYFVEAGSQAEYGFHDSGINEKSFCSPVSEYGKAKYEVWEKGSKLASGLGINYIHLRIFSVYGECDHDTTLISQCIKNMLCGEALLLSDCTQYWNYLYRWDAAKLICNLVEKLYKDCKPVCGVYNIASTDTRVLKEFVEEIKKQLNSSSILDYGAIKPVRLLSLQPSMQKTLSVVDDFEFTPFFEGICRTAMYMKNHMLININGGG